MLAFDHEAIGGSKTAMASSSWICPANAFWLSICTRRRPTGKTRLREYPSPIQRKNKKGIATFVIMTYERTLTFLGWPLHSRLCAPPWFPCALITWGWHVPRMQTRRCFTRIVPWYYEGRMWHLGRTKLRCHRWLLNSPILIYRAGWRQRTSRRQSSHPIATRTEDNTALGLEWIRLLFFKMLY